MLTEVRVTHGLTSSQPFLVVVPQQFVEEVKRLTRNEMLILTVYKPLPPLTRVPAYPLQTVVIIDYLTIHWGGEGGPSILNQSTFFVNAITSYLPSQYVVKPRVQFNLVLVNVFKKFLRAQHLRYPDQLSQTNRTHTVSLSFKTTIITTPKRRK
jgi:hypothetical protein